MRVRRELGGAGFVVAGVVGVGRVGQDVLGVARCLECVYRLHELSKGHGDLSANVENVMHEAFKEGDLEGIGACEAGLGHGQLQREDDGGGALAAEAVHSFLPPLWVGLWVGRGFNFKCLSN